MIKRKALVLFLALLLVFLSSSAFIYAQNEETPATEEEQLDSEIEENTEGIGELYAQNDKLEMYINLENRTCITIKDKQTGHMWSSIPMDYASDTIAQGSGGTINDMTSALLVSFCDDKSNKYTVSSQVSSVKRGTYKIRKYKDGSGVQIEYDFSRKSEQFIIPVRYQLEDDSLIVEILYDKINEYGTMKIFDISLMPYMVSGKMGSEGYLVIPDGSGMLVDFSGDNSNANTYEEMIYGRDMTKNLVKQTTVNEKINLPVYAASLGTSAITAIVESGDYNAYIVANPAGKSSQYANVYTKFIYRQTDNASLSDKDWNARDIFLIRDETLKENPKVKFCFSTEDTDYNGIAKTYRNYLLKNGFKKLSDKKANPSLNLQFYGLTKIKESFLGFMIDKKVTATTFDDVIRILEAVKGDYEVNTILYGFDKGGYQDIYDKSLSFDGKVGGMGGFKKLSQKAQELNTNIATVFEPTIAYKNPLFMFTFLNTATSLDRQTARFNTYMLSTGEKVKSNAYYLAPSKAAKYTQDFIKSAAKKNIGIAFESLGESLYTDYNTKKYCDRKDNAENMTKAVLTADKLYSMAFGGNIYTAKAVDHVTDIPTISSGFDIEYKSVPFYQIVMHGLLEISGKSLNFAENTQEEFLRAIATGTLLKYSVVGQNNSKIRETDLNFLYNCYYEDFSDITEKQKKFSELHNGLQNVFIDKYEVFGNITKTTFENGKVIYVNFGDKDEEIDSITIKAKDCKII
ncbi:MAG: hypothetical protein E7480_02570 [Ruminococcaceae bacterium]|nr:hypothetical protein [Oscillospiraceae bacterium]